MWSKRNRNYIYVYITAVLSGFNWNTLTQRRQGIIYSALNNIPTSKLKLVSLSLLYSTLAINSWYVHEPANIYPEAQSESMRAPEQRIRMSVSYTKSIKQCFYVLTYALKTLVLMYYSSYTLCSSQFILMIINYI